MTADKRKGLTGIYLKGVCRGETPETRNGRIFLPTSNGRDFVYHFISQHVCVIKK